MAPLHTYGSVKVPACTPPGKVDAHALITQVGGIYTVQGGIADRQAAQAKKTPEVGMGVKQADEDSSRAVRHCASSMHTRLHIQSTIMKGMFQRVVLWKWAWGVAQLCRPHTPLVLCAAV